MRCGAAKCEYYRSADRMYCSVHARAIAQGSDPPKLRKIKDAYTEALRLVDWRLCVCRQNALREEKLARELEEKKYHVPPECFMWYEPDDSDSDDSRPIGKAQKKGRFLCLLCKNTRADKTHLQSKRHKANIALYTDYLKREGIAGTETAVCEFAALCIEDKRTSPQPSGWASSAAEIAMNTPHIHPSLAMIPAHPKPALCATPKTKSTNRVCLKHHEKMVMRWICIVRGSLNLFGFRKRLASALTELACHP